MPPDRLELLWEQFLSGSIKADGARELLAYFRAYPNELERRRSEASVHGGLHYLFGCAAEQDRLVRSVQARLASNGQPEEEQQFEQKVMRDLRHRRRHRPSVASPWWIAGTAAVLLMAAGLFVWSNKKETPAVVMPRPTPPVPESPHQLLATAHVSIQSGAARVGERTVSAPGHIALNVGDSLVLESGARAQVVLSDRTTLDVSQSGTLIWNARTPAQQWKLLRGVVDANVQPQTPGAELRLETLHASVRVIGTRYRVFAFERTSVVDVVSGKVGVTRLGARNAAETTLARGDSATIDAESIVTQSNRVRRELPPSSAATEAFTDPVKLSDSDAAAPWPVRRLSYTRPPRGKGESLGYGGVVWKGGLQSGEELFEIWIRPRRVELAQAENRLMKIVLLASTGSTEYRLGDIHIVPDDRDWLLLRGRFAGASVNWQEPGRPVTPLRSERVTQLSLRTEIGNIDFDFGPLVLLKNAP